MDFVTGDAATRDCPNGVVVNMSISGGQSDASNQAAAALVSNGVFVAVAAGNDGDDAANHSPASEPTVCTVGAITEAGEIASFSNYGGVVDIFAPGDGITSVTPGGEPVSAIPMVEVPYERQY